MRILVVNLILYTPEWGIIPKVKSIKDTMISTMCKGFVKKGHEVTLLASEEYKPTGNDTYDFDIVYFKSKWKKIFRPCTVPFPIGLRRYLREHAHEYDFIVSSECLSLASFLVASVCPEKLIIWQERVCHSRKALPSKIWYNFICPIIYRNIISVVGRSQPARDFIGKYVKHVSPMILDHGVDDEKFVECLDKKNQLITSSQLVARKNVDYIIKQFAKFISRDKYADYRLLIAGRGNAEDDLRKLTVELGIENNVDFLGFLSQKELNANVGASKLFMIATRGDLNMVSVPESIVSATPLVMNTIPATAGFVESKELGVVKDNWTDEDLAEVVEHNEMYVNNCHNIRHSLLNTTIAESFVGLYKEYSGKGR